MKIKGLTVAAVFNCLYLMAATLLCVLIEAMLLFFIDRFVVMSYPVQTLIRIGVYSTGIPAILGVLCYHEGYRYAECSLSVTLLSFIPSGLCHLLMAMLFKFQAFTAGSVRFTAGLIHNGWDITAESLVEETPYGLFILTFLGYTLLYAGVSAVCKYLGAQKRIIDRAELRMHEPTETETA